MRSPLSIGIVTPTLSRSGGGIFPIVRAHARGLQSLGDSVTLYGLRDSLADEDIASLAPVVPKAYRPSIARLGYAPALGRELLRGDHDVLHQHAIWQYPSIVVSRWRRARGKPVVLSTQGMLEPWALANAALKKRLASMLFERSNLEHASCIHCSAAEVEGVRAFGLSNPIAVIPNGVELPAAAGRKSPRPEWMPEDRRTLLFLGRIHPKKGIQELVRAWSIVKARWPDIERSWRLVIAGWDDGGHVEPARALAAKLGVGGASVAFPGALFGDHKIAALSHASAFVLPSYSEGLPMTVLEAWSYGLPVLMTRACNLPEGFEAGAAIEVVPAPEALADTLARSLARTDLSTIGQKGRDLVEARFSWPTIVTELHSVYEWLAARGPTPSCVRMS